MVTNESITQDEVNKKLLKISNNLKNINDIGINYLEYFSALIYFICENQQRLDMNSIDVSLFIYEIDYSLNQLRKKENQQKLFINIRFSEVVNKKSYEVFKNIIIELYNLIGKLDKNRHMLAEAFEYVIMKAAQNNELSSINGEFYTPKEVVKTLIKLLNIRDNTAIYNPACGIGSFLIESAKCGNIYALGEENDISNYNICFVNLWLHNVEKVKVRKSSEEKFKLVDVALANPPFVSNTKEFDEEELYKYGISRTASCYTKYLAMMLEKVHNYGKVGIILPQGFLFKKTSSEYRIRKYLIDENYIDAVIGLPEKLFYTTKIPVVMLLIDKARKEREVLFIDASEEYKNKRKTNILTVENQNKIENTYKKYDSIQNYSYVANIEEIIKNEYDLNIRRYVQIKNKVENINENEIEKNINRLEQSRIKVQEQISDLIKSIK